MIDINELRALTQAVSEWSNCNHAWLDTSEDVAAAVVGHIDESGETYPVATIDCDQYYAAHQSLPLAKFYAAANPATLSELLDRLEAAEKERGNANAAAGGQSMTSEEIIALAFQCGVWIPLASGPEREQTIDKLCRFAALVAAAERDACAQIVERNAAACRPHSELHDVLRANALAIRPC